MFVKDIANRFCEELGLEGELEFLGKIAVCVFISEWSKIKYRQYLDWDAIQTHYGVGANVYHRVFESKSVGKLAECVGVYGVGGLDEMFGGICLEWGVANPCGEVGLMAFTKIWLEQNESDWLKLSEGFVLIEG